jgi:hypothetical protein
MKLERMAKNEGSPVPPVAVFRGEKMGDEAKLS